MARLGMDVTEVRGVAGNLHNQSGQLNQLMASIGQSVDKAVSVWDGPDSRKFQDEWASQHRPALQRLVQEIETLSSTARRNADQQEQVSNA